MAPRPARPNRAAALSVVRAAAAAAAAVAVALFALPSLPITAHPAHRALADEAATAAAAEGMLTRLNAARTANGLRPYRSSPLLADVAAGHAREVAEHNHYSHTGLDGRSAKQRMADAGYGAGHGGVRTSENFVARATVDEGFQWLMDDPGHRPNMLDATFREVGVGAAPTRFGFVWVLDFGTYDGVDDVPAAVPVTATSVATAPPTAAATEVVTATAEVTSTTSLTATAALTASLPSSSTQPMTDTVAVATTAALTPTAVAAGPTAGAAPSTAPAAPPTRISAVAVGVGVVALLAVVGLLALASTGWGTGRRR
ncbi:MAG: CAP domain-containing protein [Ardenticatenales bacterium]|jgi:uncharacterized protein YkwD|nr:CAP domain-containing protein [Ardenticatenales bacterium]